MKRLSKQDAATTLGVSTATIDRMIKRGDLDAEREAHGEKGHRVWVLLEDTPSGDEAGVEAGVEADVSADVATSAETREVLLERVRSLEELVSYQRGLLRDADWRYQILVENLISLPAPRAEPTAPAVPPESAPAQKPKRSWWWPFRRQVGVL